MNIDNLLDDFAKRLLSAFQATLEAEGFSQQRVEKDESYSGNKLGNILHSRRGKVGLAQSFMYKNQNTLTNYDVSNGKLNITIGSKLPYASVHENGMFVRSKGKMHKYFWAKHFLTKNPYFKYLALSVLKKGGVNIPARNYFSRTLEEFEKNQLDRITEILVNNIVAELNG